MRCAFTKMQSLGNDFILLDGIARAVQLDSARARKLADRHFGVGCDQILLVESGVGHAASHAASHAENFRLRIFNRDGGESGQCGNGARCVARFLYDAGHAKNKRMQVQTRTAKMVLTLEEDAVSVDMGAPEFRAEKIPFIAVENSPRTLHTLQVNGKRIKFFALSMGNPHAVLQVTDAASAEIETVGETFMRHASFPEGVNTGFMQIVSRAHIRLRVYERGAGETLGCGSGACAAVVAGIACGELDGGKPVRVSLPGGDAEVQWDGGNAPVILRGSAEYVFRGWMEWE